VQVSAPTRNLKYNQEIPVIYAGSKFPVEQCHHRTRVQFSVMGRFHHFHFVDDSSLIVDHEPVDALTLISEMLGFEWILRIGSGERIFFVLPVDPNDVGGKARREERER
jgi:hypothetical protein